MAAIKACSALALAAVSSALVMPMPDLSRAISSAENANISVGTGLSSNSKAAIDAIVASGSESTTKDRSDKILSGGFACPFLSCHPVRPLDYVVQFDWSECRLYETPINRVEVLTFADDVQVKDGSLSLYSFGDQAHKVAAYSDFKVNAIGEYGVTCCGEFLGFLQEDTCSPTVYKGKRVKCLKPFPKPPGQQQDSDDEGGGYATCPLQDDGAPVSRDEHKAVGCCGGGRLAQDPAAGLPPCDGTMDPKQPCLPPMMPFGPSQKRQELGDELKRDLTTTPKQRPLRSPGARRFFPTPSSFAALLSA